MNVNILERMPERQRLGVNELLQNCTVDDFDRFRLAGISEKRVLGKDAVLKYDKLMVLGKRIRFLTNSGNMFIG